MCILGNEDCIEPLVKHFSPPPPSSTSSKANMDISSVYCNLRSTKALHQSPYSIERDVTSRQGRQLLELLSTDTTVLLTKAKKLHLKKPPAAAPPVKSTNTNKESKTSMIHEDTSETVDMDLSKLLSLAHLVHYVYTPVLFLPKWRYKVLRPFLLRDWILLI